MASSLSMVFRGLNQSVQVRPKHLPMINSITSTYSHYLNSTSQLMRKKALMSWFKGIPELTALASKVGRDIVYDYHFEPVNPNISGRNKVLAANKFAQEVRLNKVMFSQAIDNLVTGESFGWLGILKQKDVKDAIRKTVSKKFGTESKEVEQWLLNEIKAAEGFTDTSKIDEDLLKPRKYRYVASSSMEIVYNQYDFERYDHVVGMERIPFSLKEIIHFSPMDIDGKPNGFTPVESILVQLELLRQMWQNHLSLHKNGGSPDKIFTLKNTRPNDIAYKRIEEQLLKYKLVENKHGNMLFTGELQVDDLQQLDKMQFMDSGLYITGLIAMQWEIPRSSIPYIVSGANTKDDTGGNSEKGYWRCVEFFQKDYAETMNTQLWIPYFGVKIIFDNTQVQQDVQKETAKQLKFNNVITMDEILSKSKKQLSEVKVMRLLGLNENDVTEREEEEFPMMGAAAGMGDQLSNSQVNDPDGKRNIAKRKQDEQTSTIQSVGMKPTGVGK